MTDRLLFYIDKSFVHFGIAKFLQEKYDFDLFAIYDLSYNQKQSFVNQNIINFKKVWFFQDHISNTKELDLEYLKSFENKYKINLWIEAYNERLFYKYNKYYKFSHDEILSIFEQECRFFENVLDEIKPNFLVIRTTDWHRNRLLGEMCKSRNIKVLMLNPSRFPGMTTISPEFDKIDDFYYMDKSNNDNRTILELQNYMKQFTASNTIKKIERRGSNVSLLTKLNIAFKIMIILSNQKHKNFYENYGRTALRFLIKEDFLLLKGKYRKHFIDKNFIREIKDDEKFVYFPMHVEPERSVSIDSPFYTNQIEVIVNIARSLPVGYKLYVKEHPLMRYRSWRSISYYKEIMSLPNVKLIHPSVPPTEIMSKCSLVVTITGTAGFEAAFYDKPAIIFSDVSYSTLSSVFRLKNIEDLPQLIRTALQKKVDPIELNAYVNLMDKNSFEFNVLELYNDLHNEFLYGGLFGDAPISIKKVELFLEENRIRFEKLASEHVKKINQYKEHESRNKKLDI